MVILYHRSLYLSRGHRKKQDIIHRRSRKCVYIRAEKRKKVRGRDFSEADINKNPPRFLGEDLKVLWQRLSRSIGSRIVMRL